MVDRYNRMLHEEEKHLIKGLAKDEEAHARLLTAACGLVKCSSGFKKGTQSYLWALDLETKGISDDYALERQILRNHGGAEAFVYGYFDRIKDFNDRYDVGTRAMGVLDVIGGASLVGAGASYCLGSGGFGCVAGGGAAALMGSDYITTGLDSIISGQSAGTKGSLLLQTMELSPETADLVYGLVGVSAELRSAANVIKYLEKNGAVAGVGIHLPTIKGIQIGLKNPSQVDIMKLDMLNGTFNFSSIEGKIAGFIDAKGNYYISEGHHRMVAAQEIYKKYRRCKIYP